MLSIKVSSLVGSDIRDVITDMIEFSRNSSVIAEQIVNGVHVCTFPDSDVESVYRGYHYAQDHKKTYAISRKESSSHKCGSSLCKWESE